MLSLNYIQNPLVALLKKHQHHRRLNEAVVTIGRQEVAKMYIVIHSRKTIGPMIVILKPQVIANKRILIVVLIQI